jgi:Family of unknown function (DUF6492)
VKSHSYALVTPSFSLDAERCRVLVESVGRWVAPGVRHYLVVDRRDVPLFNSMRSSRTEVLVVEDIAPRWLIRVPAIRRFWLSLRSLPVRNWIMQQIVKLSIPTIVREDVLLYTDSDVFFVAPYDPHAFERDGKVPLFVETGQRGLIRFNDEWHRVAAELLGLEPQSSYDTNYIGNVIPWRRAAAVALLQRISEVAGRAWQLAVTRRSAFAEYIVYGMFSQYVLGPDAGLWEDAVLRTLCYWPRAPLDVAGLEKLKGGLLPQHHSVMISAKSRTSVTDIRRVFF